MRLVEIIDLKPGQKFLEIWCGDGRVSRAVASKFPESEIIWIELAYPMCAVAKFQNLFSSPKNFQVKLANAFKHDFSPYDVIYVYGMPDKMSAKIIPQFLSQAKSWAKLYSYVFSIPKEYNEQVISYGEEGEAKIHVLEKK